MLKHSLRRLALAIPTVLLLVFVVAALSEFTPGDPAATLAGEGASREQIELVRERLNLDEPLLPRYVTYLAGIAEGDLGRGLINGVPVTDSLAAALPVTLSLTSLAITLAILLGVPAGACAAIWRERTFGRGLNVIASVGHAIPSFVVAVLLAVTFAVNRDWFPSTGYVPLGQGALDWLSHLVLPATALALSPGAEIARQTRGSLIDTLEKDFMRTVRAKGMGPLSTLGKHAGKNAAIPVVTVLALQLGRVIGGAVVIERVFALPGVGTLLIEAILLRDLVVVQGIVLVVAAGIIVINMLMDVSYGYFNPKLRY